MLSLFKKGKLGHITVTLNAKLQPIHRGELEDAFDEISRKYNFGAEVNGGGTLLEDSGEVSECDIEIAMKNISDDKVKDVIEFFEAALAPIGSRYKVEGKDPVQFGTHQGLGLYLNGSDLSQDVYDSCDVNHVYAECERLLDGIGQVNSHWEGPHETALYMYGKDFETMSAAIHNFVETYPLCQKCRIVRIA